VPELLYSGALLITSGLVWFGLVWFGFEVISSRVYHQNKLLNQKAWQKLCYCE
jgi:hypothetical protein